MVTYKSEAEIKASGKKEKGENRYVAYDLGSI
jgi:hypothetical protein